MTRTRPLILVADDDEDILGLVRFRLSRGGFDTLAARDGEEALALAAERVPDLAVLDVSMPKHDGFEVVAQLRRNPVTRGIPVILLTARARAGDVERGLASGADDYVTKPFSPELLESRVVATLRAANARRGPLASGLRAAGASE